MAAGLAGTQSLSLSLWVRSMACGASSKALPSLARLEHRVDVGV